jgi:hypothetical protein
LDAGQLILFLFLQLLVYKLLLQTTLVNIKFMLHTSSRFVFTKYLITTKSASSKVSGLKIL